ncbi:MAG: SMP-30/gluconolactonase/LRE family protein, partial [Chloroflexota bacterium]
LASSFVPDVSKIGTNEDASTGITVADRNNIGNGADLWVQFTTDAIDQEVRLFVIKAGQDFTLASAMDNPNYMNIVPSSASVATMLSAEVLDSDGDAIQEGIAYTLVVLDVEAENLSEPSNTVTLQNEGVVYTVVTGLPAATGGLDIDADGNLYFADFGEQNVTIGNTVYRITPQGDYEVFIESDALANSSGNTFDADGNYYQSGYGSGAVLRVSPEGVVDVVAEDLSGPVGVVANNDGTLYVNTCNDSSIVRITPDGEVALFARSRFLSCPNGLTQDENGTLYVANFRGSSIAQVMPDGEVTRLAQLPGSNGAHVLYHDGILYVVSRGTHQIFTVTLDGEVELLAGTGERGNQDGALLEATFTLPNALTISPDGRIIYINEVVAETDGANYPSVVRAIVLPRTE